MNNCKVSRIVYKNKNVIKTQYFPCGSYFPRKMTVTKESLINAISEMKIYYNQSPHGINKYQVSNDYNGLWVEFEPTKVNTEEIEHIEYVGFKVGDVYKKRGIDYKIMNVYYCSDEKYWNVIIDSDKSKETIDIIVDVAIDKLVEKYKNKRHELQDLCNEINQRIEEVGKSKVADIKVENKTWWKFGK